MSGRVSRKGRLTMADLARIAGVSTITVSRALRRSDNVNAGTRKRILDLAHEHGYRLNLPARNLRINRSHTIGVVIEMDPSPDRPMTGPYPLVLLGGISQALTSAGYNLLLTTLHGMDSNTASAAEGLILLGQGADDTAVRAIEQIGLPWVVWGAPRKGQNYPVVGSDNEHGGAVAASRLLGLGRRRLVFLGDTRHAEIAARYRGFAQLAQETGGTTLTSRASPFTFSGGVHKIAELHQEGISFDGVLACSDPLAMGVVRALIDHGRRVPEDVSVIGYDDSPEAESFVPPVTSVRQDWHTGGTLLARKVIALIEGKSVSSEVLETSLIVRAT
ncbi:MAG: substrate-binding domain-containing protein [Gammaproteobacteria bacterium]|nr:substrate-binding domain-containing protein [Gammaproteobacteria bacterium]